MCSSDLLAAYYVRKGDTWTKIDYSQHPDTWMKPLVRGEKRDPGGETHFLGRQLPGFPASQIKLEDGEKIIALVAGGPVTANFAVHSLEEQRVNYNVIAETKEGDHDNVLVVGAHSDSVKAGPGINDDGSGSIGILEVALNLPKYKINNAVRFGFWGAEEFGKLGSYYYVRQINQTESELAKMRAYLNFDMVSYFPQT